MIRTSIRTQLLASALLAFSCISASAQRATPPTMPPGYVEVEQAKGVFFGDAGTFYSYVYRNPETGQERRVLATQDGAIRRYLSGPVDTKDPNYTWHLENDMACGGGCANWHQYPYPKPDPDMRGRPFNPDPNKPIGKQGWNYGMGTPPEGEPPQRFKDQAAGSGGAPRAEAGTVPPRAERGTVPPRAESGTVPPRTTESAPPARTTETVPPANPQSPQERKTSSVPMPQGKVLHDVKIATGVKLDTKAATSVKLDTKAATSVKLDAKTAAVTTSVKVNSIPLSKPAVRTSVAVAPPAKSVNVAVPAKVNVPTGRTQAIVLPSTAAVPRAPAFAATVRAPAVAVRAPQVVLR